MKQLLFMVLLMLLVFGGLAAFIILRGSQLTISWTTESELDIIGFNLYRAESPGGPYTKVNDSLIPPAPDSNLGGDHRYVDRDVRPGVTYYYRLETIDRHGRATQSEPIAVPAR